MKVPPIDPDEFLYAFALVLARMDAARAEGEETDIGLGAIALLERYGLVNQEKIIAIMNRIVALSRLAATGQMPPGWLREGRVEEWVVRFAATHELDTSVRPTEWSPRSFCAAALGSSPQTGPGTQRDKN